MTSGPGPNKYVLPPTIGYDKHDITRYAYPAYSLNSRTNDDYRGTGTPGPNRYFPEEVSRTGVISSQQAIIASRLNFEAKNNGVPAPNRYCPESRPDPSWTTSRSAVVLSRYESPKQSGVIPGPKYKLNDTVGSETNDVPHEPSWHIVGRTFDYISPLRNSPGPKYAPSNLDSYKSKAPEYPIVGRNETSDSTKQIIPGPKYLGDYQKIVKEAPSWSFGVKHSEKKTMVTTEYDKAPHYGF